MKKRYIPTMGIIATSLAGLAITALAFQQWQIQKLTSSFNAIKTQPIAQEQDPKQSPTADQSTTTADYLTKTEFQDTYIPSITDNNDFSKEIANSVVDLYQKTGSKPYQQIIYLPNLPFQLTVPGPTEVNHLENPSSLPLNIILGSNTGNGLWIEQVDQAGCATGRIEKINGRDFFYTQELGGGMESIEDIQHFSLPTTSTKTINCLQFSFSHTQSKYCKQPDGSYIGCTLDSDAYHKKWVDILKTLDVPVYDN